MDIRLLLTSKDKLTEGLHGRNGRSAGGINEAVNEAAAFRYFRPLRLTRLIFTVFDTVYVVYCIHICTVNACAPRVMCVIARLHDHKLRQNIYSVSLATDSLVKVVDHFADHPFFVCTFA